MYLVIKGRTEPVQSILLESDCSQWQIGRDSSCDILLSSSQVSRRHAKLFREGEDFFLEDCGSTLGTYVDNVKITRRENSGCPSAISTRLPSCRRLRAATPCTAVSRKLR